MISWHYEDAYCNITNVLLHKGTLDSYTPTPQAQYYQMYTNIANFNRVTGVKGASATQKLWVIKNNYIVLMFAIY